MGIPVQVSKEVRRSDFLRGNFGSETRDIRPPWAINEGNFQDKCSSCDACIEACPTSILKKGRGGYPIVEFSKNECTFCGDCAKVCKPRALLRDSAAHPWTLVASINSTCLSNTGITCRICGDNCDLQAISFRLAVGGKAVPTIDLSRCTGCGA